VEYIFGDVRSFATVQSPPDELKEMLSHYSGRFVRVCLPGGNVGDQLIYAGLRELLSGYDIKFDEFLLGQKMSGDTLFFAGCGGYCRFWHDGIPGVQKYLSTFNRIFILPSTFDKDYKPTRDFLRKLPKDCEVYCRERTSYEFAAGILGQRAHLSKDTAFYIPWENFIRQGYGVLHAFRWDRESTHRIKIPKDNIDISMVAKDYEDMLKKISSYDEVHTDRAHVAIAASMLRKKTFVYDCGYFKVRAMYDYSLMGLPNTRFNNNAAKKSCRLNWYLDKLKNNLTIRARK
jgi:exopolysaccharide biosynthesis predicted pyruvyltransferase EpsI